MGGIFKRSATYIAVRGFAVIGSVSTILWIIALATSKHHRSIWELLAFGLLCFLIVALLEVWSLSRRLDRANAVDGLTTVLVDVSEEGRVLLQSDISHEAHDRWVDSGVAKIAKHDPHRAHLFAQPLESRDPSTARGLIGMRLKILDGMIAGPSK